MIEGGAIRLEERTDGYFFFWCDRHLKDGLTNLVCVLCFTTQRSGNLFTVYLRLGVLDYAGGGPIEIASGVTGLVYS